MGLERMELDIKAYDLELLEILESHLIEDELLQLTKYKAKHKSTQAESICYVAQCLIDVGCEGFDYPHETYLFDDFEEAVRHFHKMIYKYEYEAQIFEAD
jgi:hypothetical protein